MASKIKKLYSPTKGIFSIYYNQ